MVAFESKRNGMTRREMLAAGAALALGAVVAKGQAAAGALPAGGAEGVGHGAIPPKKRYLVAVDDLFLLQRQKVKAFTIGKECGLDGIGLDMGGMPGGKELKNKLRDPKVREEFLEASRKTGVAICCLAFYGMYAHIFPDMPIANQITEEWVELMGKMGVKRGHMPLMTKRGTLKEPENADVRKRTVAILKRVAPRAEKLGVVMGIESNLDGDGYKRFLDEVGSPAVQAVYNPGVGLENHYDVYKDIRELGKERICMLHVEQGSVAPEKFEHLLGDGLIDFKKLKASLDAIDYAGWLCIARSRKKGRERKVVENYTANAKFLHEMFSE